MKKLLALLLSGLLVLCLFGCGKDETTDSENTGAANNEVIDEYTYNDFKYIINEAGDYEITGYVYAGIELLDVIIPSEIEGRPVTGIGEDAFKACKNIKSVTIPSSITYINAYAFFDCDYITSIVIPESVKTIGMGAFENCDQLATVTLNTGLTDIADYAFQHCKVLTGLTLPEGLVTIGSGAFQDCVALTAITIPATVKSIGDAAFYRCSALAQVTYLADQTQEEKSAISAINDLLAQKAVENEAPAASLTEVDKILKDSGLYANGVADIEGKYVWDEETNTVSCTTLGDILFNDCAETLTFTTTAGSEFDAYLIANDYKEA